MDELKLQLQRSEGWDGQSYQMAEVLAEETGRELKSILREAETCLPFEMRTPGL